MARGVVWREGSVIGADILRAIGEHAACNWGEYFEGDWGDVAREDVDNDER